MKFDNTILGEICDFVGGSQPPKKVFSHEKLEGYVRLIQIRDYKTDNYITYIPKISTSKFCDENDIMIGRYGPPIFQILRGIKGAYNVALMKAIPNAKVLNDYLYYFLRQDLLFKYIDALSPRTGGQTGVDVPMLRQYPVLLPNIEYQRKVSGILKAIDSKIEFNNKINEELVMMANLIYDYWFMQFDFPDANGKPYKSSGGLMVYNQKLKCEIPGSWKDGFASDLFDFNPTYFIEKGTVTSYIDMNALPLSGFMTSNIQKKAFSGGMKFQNGDVVVARITPCLENGKTALISLLDDGEIGFGSTEFIVIRGKKHDLKSLACCLSRNPKFRKYAIAKMTGTSGRKRVKSSAFEEYKMAIPCVDLLQKFEKKVSPFFDKMTINTKENQKLVELRDWLLPMLMNGQIKVN